MKGFVQGHKDETEARYFQIDHDSGSLHNPLPTQTTNRYEERRHHMMQPQNRLEHHNPSGHSSKHTHGNYAPNIRQINPA